MPDPFDYQRGIALFDGVGKFESLHGVDVGAQLLDPAAGHPRHIAFLQRRRRVHPRRVGLRGGRRSPAVRRAHAGHRCRLGLDRGRPDRVVGRGRPAGRARAPASRSTVRRSRTPSRAARSGGAYATRYRRRRHRRARDRRAGPRRRGRRPRVHCARAAGTRRRARPARPRFRRGRHRGRRVDGRLLGSVRALVRRRVRRSRSAAARRASRQSPDNAPLLGAARFATDSLDGRELSRTPMRMRGCARRREPLHDRDQVGLRDRDAPCGRRCRPSRAGRTRCPRPGRPGCVL